MIGAACCDGGHVVGHVLEGHVCRGGALGRPGARTTRWRHCPWKCMHVLSLAAGPDPHHPDDVDVVAGPRTGWTSRALLPRCPCPPLLEFAGRLALAYQDDIVGAVVPGLLAGANMYGRRGPYWNINHTSAWSPLLGSSTASPHPLAEGARLAQWQAEWIRKTNIFLSTLGTKKLFGRSYSAK